MQLRTIFRTAASEEELTEEIAAGYARWRRETHEVAACYRSWVAAPRGDRPAAFAAYQEALEREERAACAYRDLVDQVRGS